MPTLNGPWQGSGYARARIVCVYTTSINADGALFNAAFYIESENRVSDRSNSWAISGSLGSTSGTNLDIDHPSGGGRTLVGAVSKRLTWNAEVACSVSGVEYFGRTIVATFTLQTGGLAPVITSAGYRTVTQTSFVADLLALEANGTVDRTQAEYGTSKSKTSTKTVAGIADVPITGLTGGTLYYFRMRLSNTIAGWGNYTGWMSVTTAVVAPSVPKSSWGVRNITATSAETFGCEVSDDGGKPVTSYEVQYNRSKSPTGATSETASINPKMTGLLPGSVYYARIRAKNAKGWSEYTDWKSFKTPSGVLIRSGGVWVVAEPYVKWNGSWKRATAYIRSSGSWK